MAQPCEGEKERKVKSNVGTRKGEIDAEKRGQRGSPGAKRDGSYRMMMMRMDAITLRQGQRKACSAQLSSGNRERSD